MSYEYSGSIYVKFNDLPGLRPILLITQFDSFIKRFQGATARRYFHLEQDWNVVVKDIEYDQNLNGTIIVPETFQNAKTRFDGASIPLPWVVSFLSFGILRPLGILLTASIIHDFAFEQGGLLYRDDANGAVNLRSVARDVADQLFRDMISTVNRTPLTAFIAWVFVRLGWFFVKYNGQRFGGKVPYLPLAAALTVLLLFAVVIQLFGLASVISVIVLFYLIIYGTITVYH